MSFSTIKGSRDKRTGQAKKLATGWDGLGQSKFGTGLPGQPKSRTGRGTKWDRAEKYVQKQEKDVLKQEKDVLKQENDVQKQ